MFAARSLVAIVAALLAAQATDGRQVIVYNVSGKDSFSIGSRELRSEVAYTGSQRLEIRKNGDGSRFTAEVSYRKTDEGQVQDGAATFVSIVYPDGRERDERNTDPDFLTVLNQPFAVQLDAQTIRDVGRLKVPSPFAFTSSMTGATLRGVLYHVTDGAIAGHPVVGIGFDASGPMRGGIPEHREITLKGTIRMSGRAYYTRTGALLLALDATLQIAGTLADGSTADPVRILYRRTIRAI